MNDHNLDDLIIGDPDSGGGRSKSLLSLVALALIILIVGVLLAKLLFSGPEELEEGGNNTELTGIVKPAGSDRDTGKKQAPSAHPVESIPDELKPITREKVPKSEELKPLAPVRPAAKPKAEKKPITIETRPKPKKPVAKPKPKPKPKAKPSELFKKKSQPNAAEPATQRVYYIQVGSFKRMPEQKFLDKMKTVGYEPVIVKTGTMIKVRVGPYGSYAEAKAKLPEVKEKLGIDGFVVRKK
jgi:cell division protein FtsN